MSDEAFAAIAEQRSKRLYDLKIAAACMPIWIDRLRKRAEDGPTEDARQFAARSADEYERRLPEVLQELDRLTKEEA